MTLLKLQRINTIVTNFNNSASNIQTSIASSEEILTQDILPIEVIKCNYTKKDNNTLNIRNSIKKPLLINPKAKVYIDIRLLNSSKPQVANYTDITQNTEEWYQLRRFKITGTRLPLLLGLQGKNKLMECWSTVKTGKREDDKLLSIKNIKRGVKFEKTAISYFEKVSQSKTIKCGFFTHPTKIR